MNCPILNKEGIKMVNCLILNAGNSTRMGGGLPKALLPLRKKDETILSRQLRQLHYWGVKDITVATTQLHYDRYFHKYDVDDRFKITVNRGTECVHTLLQCFDILDNSNHKSTLVLHGDVVMEDNVIYEILTQTHWTGTHFIGNNDEIYAVQIDQFGLVSLEMLIIRKENDIDKWKLWDLYHYLNKMHPQEVWTPKGFICDIDTGIKYEQLKNTMMVKKL